MTSRFAALSPRQRAVCALVVEGLTNEQIAARLGTTAHTVKAHRAEVMRRSGARSLVELVHLARAESVTEIKPEEAPAEPSRPLRIVVLDADPAARHAAVAALAARGHSAAATADERGLDELVLRPGAPPLDVALVDLATASGGQGGADALLLATRLRSRLDCGLVVASTRGALEDRLRAFEAGADVFLVKPIDGRELCAVVANVGRRVRRTAR